MMTEEQIIEAAIKGHASTRDAIRWAMNQVRNDSEPVAFEFQHEDTGLFNFVDPQQVERGFQKNNPRWQLIGPVFRHPAPVVVRQLVDALRMVMDEPDALDGRPRTYECVQEALAAAKEARL